MKNFSLQRSFLKRRLLSSQLANLKKKVSDYLKLWKTHFISTISDDVNAVLLYTEFILKGVRRGI